jgi:peroxiredoxin Q/BCP
VQILGASFDSVEDNAAFAQKYKFPFPLLCDTNREIGMAYGACDSPQAGSAKRITYVIDPQGKIERAFEKVSAAKHPEELLEVVGSD